MTYDHTSAILKAVSLILDYPAYENTGLFTEEVRSIAPEDEKIIESFLRNLDGMDIVDIQQDYVATFDMNPGNPLYLTAWELGDGRGRGNALIEMKRTIESFHFTVVEGELPDYIPLILEFLAEVPQDGWPPALETRLQAYFSAIGEKINSRLYGDIVRLLAGLFRKRTDIPAPEPVKADTGVMPFPVRYNGGDY